MPQARSSHRILSFLFLLALSVGLASVPLRLAAQETTKTAEPAAASTAQSTEAPAAKAEEAPKKEQDENETYLHSPIVQSIARHIHLDVDTTAKIFEFITFAIIILAIGIPLFRMLPKLLRKRKEKISADIESARKVSEDANSRLAAIEAKLAGLDTEISRIRVQVETESRQDMERIHASIGEESARIVSAAEQEISATAAQAQRSLRNFAADLAIDQAMKQLILTPETDRALIAEFLDEAARDGAQMGGRK